MSNELPLPSSDTLYTIVIDTPGHERIVAGTGFTFAQVQAKLTQVFDLFHEREDATTIEPDENTPEWDAWWAKQEEYTKKLGDFGGYGDVGIEGEDGSKWLCLADPNWWEDHSHL